mmetsp:Transcript_29862/g.92782  ORF Transcript_29862/g.92782 Transcript_29862/m.92782 type:complete len:104 (+) Transcript_29862:126-437(+)
MRRFGKHRGGEHCEREGSLQGVEFHQEGSIPELAEGLSGMTVAEVGEPKRRGEVDPEVAEDPQGRRVAVLCCEPGRLGDVDPEVMEEPQDLHMALLLRCEPGR